MESSQPASGDVDPEELRRRKARDRQRRKRLRDIGISWDQTRSSPPPLTTTWPREEEPVEALSNEELIERQSERKRQNRERQKRFRESKRPRKEQPQQQEGTPQPDLFAQPQADFMQAQLMADQLHPMIFQDEFTNELHFMPPLDYFLPMDAVSFPPLPFPQMLESNSPDIDPDLDLELDMEQEPEPETESGEQEDAYVEQAAEPRPEQIAPLSSQTPGDFFAATLLASAAQTPAALETLQSVLQIGTQDLISLQPVIAACFNQWNQQV